MSIQMIGIDHTRAGIDVRTVFSFTKKKMAEALAVLQKVPGDRGLCADFNVQPDGAVGEYR